tara:strand:- start:774 stop:1868 length:1095 start_codon:yes stop_codon:yes gene_type:complete
MIQHKAIIALFFIALLIFSLGNASVLLLTELWSIKEVNWQLSNSIFVLYIFFLLGTYLCLQINFSTVSFKSKFLDDVSFFGPTSTNVVTLLFFLSAVVLLTAYTSQIYFPFSNFFLMLIFLAPVMYFAKDKPSIAVILIMLSMIIFFFSGNRANIFFIFLIIFLCSKISILRLGFVGMIVLSLMLLISFLRSENIGNQALLSEIFVTSFGSEWRDGMLANDMFSKIEIMNAREFFIKNFITFLPGWSFIVSSELAYQSQLQTYLVDNLGLAGLGYTGVRVGMIWESFILFGKSGVIMLGVVSGVLIYLAQKLINHGSLFIGSIITIAVIYSLVGFPLYIVSNFGQLIFYYLAIKLFIVLFIKSS